MPTPTNSVLNRGVGDEDRISQLIYDNESLRIEVEMLREQLERTGALEIEDLRATNEALRVENGQIRVQLQEKTAQLDALQHSDTRFSNIDDSLKKLLEQIGAQREELAELRLVGKEKDDRLVELRARLTQTKSAAGEAAAKAQAQQEELLANVERLQRENVAVSSKAQAAVAARVEAEQRAADLAARLSLSEEQVAAQAAAVAEWTARERAAQETIASLRAEMSELRGQLAREREQVAQLGGQHPHALEQPAAVARGDRKPAAAAGNGSSCGTGSVDVSCPEVAAYVALQVKRAVEDRDARLREQAEQNASLLSRMALIQQESENTMKRAGLTGREVNAMNERVEAMTCARDARSTMEQRVACFLTNTTFSREDVQKLLQEMLDYQERTAEDMSTRLLIKDMQAEEAEKALRSNLKRVENENASLLKQLQRAAFESVKRHQRGGSVGSVESNEGAEAAAAAERSPSHPNANPGYTDVHRQQRNSLAGSEEAALTHSAEPHLPHWPPRPAPYHPQPQYQDPAQLGVNSGHPAPGGAPQLPDTTAAMYATVRCPACTYEQRLANGRCDMCDTPLTAPPR